MRGSFSTELRQLVQELFWMCFIDSSQVSQNVTTLLAGRFLVGLAVGLASVIAPVYISEASPPSVRARLVRPALLCSVSC